MGSARSSRFWHRGAIGPDRFGSGTERDSGVPVVELEGVVKRLGRRVLAVDGLDLVVKAGQVFGLAGPNGAGKSVTLRILLGLVRPSAGSVRLFGEPVRPGARALGRVGALVDGPGFVPHLSGLQNLRLAWRLTRPSRPEADLDHALRMAGLGDAIDRPYATYSHGMRYRLGLAQALLGHPELLVLDEPATGLDPIHAGHVRAAIAEEARRGTTVLLSSHHMSEIEQVCTHAAVMQQGRVVASGAIAEVVGPQETVFLKVDDQARARAALGCASGVGRVLQEGGGLRVEGDRLRPVALLSVLDAAGVRVAAFHRGRTLEEAYLDLFQAGRDRSR